MKKFITLISVFILTLCISACSLVQTKEIVKSPDENVKKETVDKKEDDTTKDACTPLLYKVTDGKGGVLYLLGSIHVGDKRMKQMPDYILEAYEESDFLAVECDIIAFEKDFSKQLDLTTMMLCSEGTTVKDYLGEDLFSKVKTFLEEKDSYNEMYEYYVPALWSSLIDDVILKETGLKTTRGADRLFLKMAKDNGKEIREVESVEFQYNMMLNFSNELYKLLIESTIDTAEEGVEEIKTLYEMWLRGNEDELGKYLSGDEEDLSNATDEETKLYAEYEKAMLTNRNLGMLAKAEEYLAEGTTGFYVVGAAHVVGEGSLAEMLKDAGYKVTIVK